MRCSIEILIVAIVFPALAHADLEPDEVAIIATANSRSSRSLAAYYADAREIPRSHICLIDVEPNKRLDRVDWQSRIRPAIQSWLVHNGLEERIRCFATMWDVPLTIGRRSADAPIVTLRRAFLEKERQLRVQQLSRVIDQVNQLGLETDSNVDRATIENSNADQIKNLLEETFRAAKSRLARISDPPRRQSVNKEIQQAFVAAAGINALVSNVNRSTETQPRSGQLNRQLDIARGRLAGLRESKISMEAIVPSVSRDEQILDVIEKSDGLLGSVVWIDAQLDRLRRNETRSSFDSELSLVLWPGYNLDRWIANTLHHRFDGTMLRWKKPVIMVSRLEAPTIERAKELIDTAKTVERNGLAGTFYIDSRGLATSGRNASKGSYEDYDQTLQSLASQLKNCSTFPVIIDKDQPLFQPGQCPDAALYCGWYSLGNYVDAFEWNPGSVAYHIASSEATTLRNPGSQVWCKRMLEEGVCATLGPAFEPYLVTFPRPNEFFPVLMSGQYTLVESYYRTKPVNSWAMVLVGDPLYNPFKYEPAIDVDKIPDRWKRLVTRPKVSP